MNLFKVISSKRVVIVLLAAVLLLGCLCILKREAVFLKISNFLLCETNPEKSDVLVILRGDRNYARTLEAVRLFESGYAGYIYVSSALIDESSTGLKAFGIDLPCEQERLKNILLQSNIPPNKITLGNRKPGGGTQGELRRIRAMMIARGFKSAIIVTSWWHTLRTHKTCRKVFRNTGIRILVVAARNDKSNPSNWWKYRYESIDIIEEFPKLIVLYLSPSENLSFLDDP